jgi:hypothetical protein
MKLTIFAAFCICMMSAIGYAQGKSQSFQCPPGVICDPRVFDEYSNISWSDEKARLDNVADTFKKETNARIFLSVYGGRRECIGGAQARAIRAKNYLVNKHSIQSNLVLWQDAGYRKKQTVEIWIQPLGVDKPYPAPTLNKSDVQLINCRARNKYRRKRGGS